MKTIKKYTQAEIRALVITHNLLVHPCYLIDDSTLSRLILDGYQDQNLVLPYYAIPFQETLSGHSERVYLEWHKKYTVITLIKGTQFYLDKDGYMFNNDKEQFISDYNTAKQVYDKSIDGLTQLREYDGSNNWEKFNILNIKTRKIKCQTD